MLFGSASLLLRRNGKEVGIEVENGRRVLLLWEEPYQYSLVLVLCEALSSVITEVSPQKIAFSGNLSLSFLPVLIGTLKAWEASPLRYDLGGSVVPRPPKMRIEAECGAVVEVAEGNSGPLVQVRFPTDEVYRTLAERVEKIFGGFPFRSYWSRWTSTYVLEFAPQVDLREVLKLSRRWDTT